MKELLLTGVLVFCGFLVLGAILDAVLNKDAYLKETCLQAGGTAMEQPAGTFIRCIK